MISPAPTPSSREQRAAGGAAAPPDLRRLRGLPRLPLGFVPTAAVQELAAGPLPPLLLLQAPRGYGKTATTSWLLRQDADQRNDHVWVTLPPGRVGADVFWESVQRRLRAAGLADDDWDAVDRLLQRRRRRLVLVVDDLERVVDRSVDDRLGELVSSYENFHVVVMSRTPGRLALAATLLDGVALKITDLTLTPTDVVRMAEQLGLDIPADALDDLHRRLMGWPALLRLALERPVLDGHGRVQLDPAVIGLYVQQRLEDEDDADYRTVVTVLSVPESVPSELAVRLVGREQFDRVAGRLREDYGGVLPLVETRVADDVREATAAVLEELDPDRYREVNLEASRWYAAHAQPAPALRHALAASDWEAVGRQLRDHWSVILADHPDVARQAIDRLPQEVVDADPRLLVARDYILNVFTADRAAAAYEAGLLVPEASIRARAARRLSLRQVLSLRASGLHDVTHNLVESRDLDEVIRLSGWSPEVVAEVPGLLLEWSLAYLLGNPGTIATYAFSETAAWAEHAGADEVRRSACAGAALTHVLLGNPNAARPWLDLVARLPAAPAGSVGVVLEQLARALAVHHAMSGEHVDVDDLTIPDELADLEAIRLKLRAQALLVEGRGREAVRMLSAYRVRPSTDGTTSMAEHAVVTALVEAHLAVSQVERARRLLLDVDPDARRHHAAWALVDFQSGEYERVLGVDAELPLLPRQTLQLALLRACAGRRVGQHAVAADAFQAAVSTATQTGMLRPFGLIPAADLDALADGDQQVAELLSRAVDLRPLLEEPQDGSRLSPRELQVLEAVATGASFASVASRLFVSPNTVKSQMRDIYRKLDARGRDQAVERARELGLLRR